MSSKYSNLNSILGDWSEILGDILYREDVKEFASALKTTKALPFDEIYGDDDYFKTIREMPFEGVKVLYIKEFADSPEQQLQEIEAQIFDNFNLAVSVQPDFSWLTKQGVVIYPRYYTWGTPTSLHKQWSLFTDEALVRIAKSDPRIIICTNNPEIRTIITKHAPLTMVICHSPIAWRIIDGHIMKAFETKVNWTPKI